jgi:hypothetical protein
MAEVVFELAPRLCIIEVTLEEGPSELVRCNHNGMGSIEYHVRWSTVTKIDITECFILRTLYELRVTSWSFAPTRGYLERGCLQTQEDPFERRLGHLLSLPL